MLELDVRPVLTAHPTESTPARSSTQAPLPQFLAREAAPLDEVDSSAGAGGRDQLLWLTRKSGRIDPRFSTKQHCTLISRRDCTGGSARHSTLALAFEEEFSRSADAFRLSVPSNGERGWSAATETYVTPRSRSPTARRPAKQLGRYLDALEELVRRLSLSATIVPPTDALTNPLSGTAVRCPNLVEEPAAQCRRAVAGKLSFMSGRIEAIELSCRARCGTARERRRIQIDAFEADRAGQELSLAGERYRPAARSRSTDSSVRAQDFTDHDGCPDHAIHTRRREDPWPRPSSAS